jgi:hypothetical protein
MQYRVRFCTALVPRLQLFLSIGTLETLRSGWSRVVERSACCRVSVAAGLFQAPRVRGTSQYSSPAYGKNIRLQLTPAVHRVS